MTEKTQSTEELHEQVRRRLLDGEWLEARAELDELMQRKRLPGPLPELKEFRKARGLALSFQAILQDRITGVNIAYRSQKSHEKWS